MMRWIDEGLQYKHKCVFLAESKAIESIPYLLTFGLYLLDITLFPLSFLIVNALDFAPSYTFECLKFSN